MNTFVVRLFDLTGSELEKEGVEIQWPEHTPVPSWGEGFSYQKKVGVIGDSVWVYETDRFGAKVVLELYLVDHFDEEVEFDE